MARMRNREKSSKRKTNLGVRLIGERIYDFRNGKSCHQCRQKTMDFVASCKVMKKNKQCTIKFYHKSLSLRYREMAEEVAKLNDWICPQCRGNYMSFLKGASRLLRHLQEKSWIEATF